MPPARIRWVDTPSAGGNGLWEALHREVDRQAGVPDGAEQCRQLIQTRCGLAGFALTVDVGVAVVGVVVGVGGAAEHPQQLVQIGDRLWDPGLYCVNGLQCVVGTGVEQPLGDPGLDAHEGDVVGDHSCDSSRS